jgi:hypothetical protein
MVFQIYKFFKKEMSMEKLMIMMIMTMLEFLDPFYIHFTFIHLFFNSSEV